MEGRGLICLGNRGGYQTSGGNSGSLEGGRGVAGGGNYQIMNKRGKLLADVGIEEIVRSGSVCAPT